MIIGLGIMAVGALDMVPAARLTSYEITLIALLVIACGIALLQVAANPYVAVIGPPESAESRLTLVQAFNSMGTFFAAYFGGYLILSRTVSGTTMISPFKAGQGEHLIRISHQASESAVETAPQKHPR